MVWIGVGRRLSRDVSDHHEGDGAITPDDLLRAERSIGSIPSRDRGAHGHHPPRGFDWVWDREAARALPVEDRLREERALAVSLGENSVARAAVETADLGVTHEAFALELDVEPNVRRYDRLKPISRFGVDLGRRLLRRFDEGVHRVIHDPLQEVFLGREVVVKPRNAHPGTRRDLSDR